ncbi:MAG TPA: winged helix-turn-helix domain-containing protein [Solirubrobacterales bacterium]|nr:winged helix-turn-helix domain-containing protein [Solirubrobacterales bacterium]
MTGTELRDSWTCGACRVTSRNPRVGAVPMPERWDRDGEGRPRCLSCGKAARSEGRGDDKRAARQRRSAEVRRREREEREAAIADALLDLEPGEVAGPEALAAVAAVTGLGEGKVANVRKAMWKDGRLERPVDDGPLAETAAALRSAGRGLTGREVAAELGVSLGTARARLYKLEQEGRIAGRLAPERASNSARTPPKVWEIAASV